MYRTGCGEWRGEVRHAYFREWGKLVDFPQRVLAESERGGGGGDPG